MSVTALPSIRKDHHNIGFLGDLLDSDVYFIPFGVDYDGCGIMQSACWSYGSNGQPGATCHRVRYGPEAPLVPYTDEIPF